MSGPALLPPPPAFPAYRYPLRTIPEAPPSDEGSTGSGPADDPSISVSDASSSCHSGGGVPRSLGGWWHVMGGGGGGGGGGGRSQGSRRSDGGDSTAVVLEGGGSTDGEDDSAEGADGWGGGPPFSPGGDTIETAEYGSDGDVAKALFTGGGGRRRRGCGNRRGEARCSGPMTAHGLLCLSTFLAAVVGLSVYLTLIAPHGGGRRGGGGGNPGRQHQDRGTPRPSPPPPVPPPVRVPAPSPEPSRPGAPRPTGPGPMDPVGVEPDPEPEQEPDPEPGALESSGGDDGADAGDVPTPSSPPVGSSAPTWAPSHVALEMESLVYELLSTVSDPYELRDRNTARGRAARWMMRGDLVPDLLRPPGRGGSRIWSAGDVVGRRRYVQRYVLAVLRFCLSGDGGGGEWGRGVDHADDGGGDEDWLSSSHECSWRGVSCASVPKVDDITGKYAASSDSDAVTHIVLPEMGLSGTLPPELGRGLSSLRELTMYDNSISGSVPSELLGGTNQLYYLDLAGNALTGSIPMPPPGLEFLYLSDNALSGILPSPPSPRGKGTRGPYRLKHLWADRNQLSGGIPEGISHYRGLESLIVYNNSLTSTLPESMFSNLTKLRYLDVSYNGLTGRLPGSMYRCTSLDSLYLTSNALTGPIRPRPIRRLVNLRYLWAESNRLRGSIPWGLSRLTRLRSVLLQDNGMGGTVPPEVCGLVGAGGLRILEADCKGGSPVNCTCCTACH